MIDEKQILADCETALEKFPNSVVFRVVYEHVHALLAERKRLEAKIREWELWSLDSSCNPCPLKLEGGQPDRGPDAAKGGQQASEAMILTEEEVENPAYATPLSGTHTTLPVDYLERLKHSHELLRRRVADVRRSLVGR